MSLLLERGKEKIQDCTEKREIKTCQPLSLSPPPNNENQSPLSFEKSRPRNKGHGIASVVFVLVVLLLVALHD